MPERVWSDQQQAIFKEFATGTGHVIVQARAGAAKTSSAIEAINYAPESHILLAAFNKRIAEELSRRLTNPRAEARTLHSVGFSFVRQNWQSIKINEDRKYRVAEAAWSEESGRAPEASPGPVISLLTRLVSMVKSVCPLGTSREIMNTALAFNLVVENQWAEEYPLERLVDLCRRTLTQAAKKDGTIDFDDMIWLPIVHQWLRPRYDLVVVDEGQDVSAAQLLMIRGIARGRIVFVGDSFQGIYKWRGADSGVLDRMKEELGAVEYPLTTTYRCPQAIVRLAQGLVPDFQAAPGAPEGEIQRIPETALLGLIQPNDFLLSRTNAPLARCCLSFLRNGKKARIEGRDIAKGLVALIRRMKVSHIPDLMEKLQTWQTREMAKLAKLRGVNIQPRVDYIIDQVETVEALTEGLASAEEVTDRIEELFGEARGPAIICSTIHRAKGLEAPRVFILTRTLYLGGRRIDQEERNLAYVSVTRAQQALFLVGDGLVIPPESGVGRLTEEETSVA